MCGQWHPPYPPILLPTKTIGMHSWLCGGRNHRETRKKASTENQSCLGERAKGLRAKASRGQLAELGVSSSFLGAAMDLISRGAVFKALVFLCFIRSSHGTFRLSHSLFFTET